MKVRNASKIRAITLATGQRLEPGDEGEAPRSRPIQDLIRAGYLEKVPVPSSPSMQRTSSPVPIQSTESVPDVDADLEMVSEFAALKVRKAKEVAAVLDQPLLLHGWKKIETRETVLAIIEERLAEIGE